jgi:hypothetical protein
MVCCDACDLLGRQIRRAWGRSPEKRPRGSVLALNRLYGGTRMIACCVLRSNASSQQRIALKIENKSLYCVIASLVASNIRPRHM